MSRDFDDIYKKIDQSHKELYKQENELSKDIANIDKNQEKMLVEIKDIKKQIKGIEIKVDLVLEILNSFTILLAEEEDRTEEYLQEEDNPWKNNQEEDWNSYTEDDDDEYNG